MYRARFLVTLIITGLGALALFLVDVGLFHMVYTCGKVKC